jgi:hypothetical protein
MKLLISIRDIADFTSFSRNISDELTDPYIRAAQTFDVQLPTVVRAALEAQLENVLPDFKPDEFEAADFATTATDAGWVDTKLARVWYEAIRPLLVMEAARRMLLWHGLHITPNGAENTSDRPLSTAQRSELRADLIGQAAYYRPLFEVGLRSLSPTPAPTACRKPSRRPSSGGLQMFSV